MPDLELIAMEKLIIFTSPNKRPSAAGPGGVPPPNQLSYQSSAKSKAKLSRKANTSHITAIEDGLYVYELDLLKKKGGKVPAGALDDDDPEELALQRAVDEKRRKSRDEGKSPVMPAASLSFLPTPPVLVLDTPATTTTATTAAHSASAPVAIGGAGDWHRQHLCQHGLWDKKQQRALKAGLAKGEARGRQAVVAGIHKHSAEQQRRQA